MTKNDRIALPHVKVSEVHQFNSACQITKIVGTVNGNLVCPGGKSPSSNPTLIALCAAYVAAGGGSSVVPIVPTVPIVPIVPI